MKLLTFVDLHGSDKGFHELSKKIKKYKPDALICAGDITIFETDIKSIVHKLDQLGKLIYIIHGNHENSSVLSSLCAKSKNLLFLHKKFMLIDDLFLIGYGGGGFGSTDKEFDQFGKHAGMMLLEKKKNNPHLKSILILHGPPYKCDVDEIYGEHAGNKSYGNFIRKYDPDLVLCGHLHENAGKEDRLGKSRVINPGPFGKIIEF